MFARQFIRKFTISASGNQKRESTFKRIWVKEYAAWPTVFFTSFILIFGGLKVVHALTSPDLHFNKRERGTLDFLENERDQKSIDRWAESNLHKGPKFIRDLSPYKHYENIKPSN